MARWGLPLLLLTFSQVCLAETVTLILRNGDRLTGEMLMLDTQNVTITNTLLGRVTIPVAQVEKLEKKLAPGDGSRTTSPTAPVPTSPLAAPAPTNRPTAAPPPTPSSKPVETAATKPAVVPPAQPKPKPPKRWNLDAQLGLDMQFNQRERELYYGRAKWTYGRDRFRSIVDYIANYGETDGVLTANDMNGSIKGELDVTKKFFVFDAVGSGYNEIRKIDFSYDNSFGLGYKVLNKKDFIFKKDTFIFNTEFGANYQEQFFSNGTSRDYFSLRLGETAAWKINAKLSFDEKLEYYPRLTGWEDYRVRFEATLRYLVMPNLTLNFTVIDLYDTQPAPGVTRNDLLLRASLGIKF